MKKLFLALFLISIIISSCGESIKSGLDKQIVNTDSIKVYFFSEKDNSTEKVITINDKGDIEKIIASITDIGSEQYKCGYSGQMDFYKSGKIVLSPEFNLNIDCAHYVFRYKDKMYHKEMGEEGQLILTELRKK